MTKTWIRIVALALCGLLVLGLALTAFADEVKTEEITDETAEEVIYGGIIAINTLEDFLNFAEFCRLDSYSLGLCVTLETDIDLTDVEFEPIPIFCGTFEGNGHTISGLNITGHGSSQGLFRYVRAGAVVRNLNVEGTVAPGGSACYVGGIAGQNGGLIQNCSFQGTVTGTDQVGGIAGRNALGGIIENCQTDGTVFGSHFVGGAVGENAGVIRACVNTAQVNTTVKQNSVEITDITLETLTSAETITTVTDIGGIAGSSGGVIRDCENRGDVGYPHIGYNIGGIAGSQTGYVAACENYGAISGRKEVGGIVGQMEPSTYMEFTADTLQTLEEQLGVMSGLAGQATANAQNAAADISGQAANIGQYVEDAKGALKMLVPEEGESFDPDTLVAARNALNDALSGMNNSVNNMASSAMGLVSNLGKDMQAVMNQMSTIMAIMENASEGLGGSIYDVSDQDTDGDILAKVTLCVNFGDVLGDRNVGGVLGAVSYESDLDPDEDVDKGGNYSLNYDVQVRAVVLSCKNEGNVEGRNGNTGGVVGWMYLGLIRNCVNTGNVDAADADHVGGIVGLSQGYVRYCAAKCVITGGSYVGGIAGEANVITTNGAMVRITASEKSGAIAGWVETLEGETLPVLGNYYLNMEGDYGAIDGISYAGKAECAGEEVFFAMDLLLDAFHTVTVRFVQENGEVQRVELSYGDALTDDQIPGVSPKENCTGYWEGLAETDLSRITFDMTFEAAYIADSATIASSLTDGKGLPIVLAQGKFTGEETVELQELTGDGIIAGWVFTLPENAVATQLRYRIPEGWDAEALALQVRCADGSWRTEEFTTGGSYLVFPLQEGDSAFRVTEAEQDHTLQILICAAGAAVVVLLIVVLIVGKKQRKKKA